MLTKTTKAALAALLALGPTAQSMAAGTETAIILAQTDGSERRDDRQDDRQGDRDNRQGDRDDRSDDRQDCRQAEGAGGDKRDCKQEGRQDRNADG